MSTEAETSPEVVAWILGYEKLTLEERLLESGETTYTLVDGDGMFLCSFPDIVSGQEMIDRLHFLVDFCRKTILGALSDGNVEFIEMTDWGIIPQGKA